MELPNGVACKCRKGEIDKAVIHRFVEEFQIDRERANAAYP